jgi:hypothetical protein
MRRQDKPFTAGAHEKSPAPEKGRMDKPARAGIQTAEADAAARQMPARPKQFLSPAKRMLPESKRVRS